MTATATQRPALTATRRLALLELAARREVHRERRDHARAFRASRAISRLLRTA